MYTAADNVFKQQGHKRLEINNELILKWEPKVYKMLANVYVYGYDKEDLAQELRLVICKAAKLYNPNKKTIFHTYLHTAMANTLKTLWMKSAKRLQSYSLDKESETNDNNDYHYSLNDFTKQIDINLLDLEVDDLLNSLKLDKGEKQFLIDKFKNRTMRDIESNLKKIKDTEIVNKEEVPKTYSVYKVKKSLRNKFREND